MTNSNVKDGDPQDTPEDDVFLSADRKSKVKAGSKQSSHNFAAFPMTMENLAAKIRAVLDHLDIPATERLAVAVSGGSDSLALVLACERIAPVVGLTVDHGLRDGSAAEAEKVGDILKDNSIDHHILTWREDKPKANIQSAARDARYRLLEGWCLDNGIRYLLTGHQRDDLAETFMLRLMRGSGVDGLAAMPMKDRGLVYPQDITRIRPLLNVSRAELQACLKAEGVTYIDDPSNQNDRFERTKVRKFLEDCVLEGLSVGRLADTAERMRWARDALEEQTKDWFFRTVSVSQYGSIRLSANTLAQAPRDVGLRLLASTLSMIGGNAYRPRLSALTRLFDGILSNDFKGQTLGGVIFEKSWEDGVFMIRESSDMPIMTELRNGAIYDRRWRVSITTPDQVRNLTLRALGQQGWQQLKLQDHVEFLNELRHQERLGLPAFFNGDTCIGLAVDTGRGAISEAAAVNPAAAYGGCVTLVPPFYETGAAQRRLAP